MFSNPELLQLILTILYMALLSVLSVVEITGVYLMPAIVWDKELEYWQVGLYTIGFVFSLFFCIGCYRLMKRKAFRMEVFDNRKTKSIFLRFSKYLSLMSIYLILTWLALVTWSIILYAKTESFNFISLGVFGSGAVLCFARAYVYFILNDYNYLQDVNKLNKFIDRHNKKIEEMEIKKAKIQEDFANGTLVLPKATKPKPVAAKP